mmetsp:Transcript_17441/g.45300  ORF Transcript_17441/g.45300 Transcript_17441/m.45300 type:complete len:1202 (+) Transcript_17441:275-3880(+)
MGWFGSPGKKSSKVTSVEEEKDETGKPQSTVKARAIGGLAGSTPHASWGPENHVSVLSPPEVKFDAIHSQKPDVTDCAVSDDGQFLVFTQIAGGCSVYELHSGKNMPLPSEHSLNALALWSSPDCSTILLATGGGEQTVRIFDLTVGCKERSPPIKCKNDIYDLCWSHDGQEIVVGGREFIEVLHVSNNVVHYEERFEYACVHACGFHPLHKNHVAYGGTEGWCYVIEWSATEVLLDAKGRPIKPRKKKHSYSDRRRELRNEKRARNVQPIRDNSHTRGSMQPTKTKPVQMFYHGMCISQIEYHSSGDFLLTGGGHKAIMWGLEENESHRIFTDPSFKPKREICGADELWQEEKARVPGITSAHFSSTGEKIVVAGEDRVIVWHVKTGGQLHTFNHREKVNACCFGVNDRVISGGEDWSLRVRDTSTGIELRRVTQQGVEHVSEDGKLYFLTDIQGNGEVRSLLTNDTVLRTQCLCDGLAKLSPVSNHLAMRIPTPGVEGLAKVKVWNITDMGFDGPGSPRKLQRKMTFTEEFNGARDGSGELVFKLPESWPLDVPKSEFQVDAIEFSPCGNFLAVAVGYEIYIQDVLSGRPVYHWSDAKILARTRCLQFSHDGSILASGVGFKGYVILHDINSIYTTDSRVPTMYTAGTKKKAASVNTTTYGEADKLLTNFDMLDANGDGVVSKEEAIAMTAHKKKANILTEAEFAEAWDEINVQITPPILDHGKCSIMDITFAPDMRHIVTCMGDLVIWDLETKLRAPEDAAFKSKRTCCFSPDGNFLLASENLYVKDFVLLDTRNWKAVRRCQVSYPIKGCQFVAGENDQVNFLTRSEGAIAVYDFERLRTTAPTPTQLVLCQYDLEYVKEMCRQFPYLLFAKITYPPLAITDQTFINHAIQMGDHVKLRELLRLVPDAALVTSTYYPYNSVFEQAIHRRDRKICALLFDAMCRTSQAAARGPLVDALPQLIIKWPDLVAELFAQIGLEECSCQVHECRTDEPMYQGSHEQNAEFLWVHDVEETNKRQKHMSSKAVKAFKVGLPHVAHLDILKALLDASADLGQLELFDNEIINSVIKCYWSNHVRRVFLKRFWTFGFVFLTYICWCLLVQQEMQHVSHDVGHLNVTAVDDDISQHESRVWKVELYYVGTSYIGYFLAFSDCLLLVQGFMFMQIEFKQVGAHACARLRSFARACARSRRYDNPILPAR